MYSSEEGEEPMSSGWSLNRHLTSSLKKMENARANKRSSKKNEILSQRCFILRARAPLIDWEAFRPILKGLYDNKSPKGGRPNVDPVVMVKLLVLQQ